MRGDKLLIKKYHTIAAEKLIPILLPQIRSSSAKYVITVAGESGAGKTEIAHEIARFLKKNNISSVTLHQDDYFRIPPKTNPVKRRKNISIVGTSEVKLGLLNKHINLFRNIRTKEIEKPLVFFKQNCIKKEYLKCADIKVLIVEGTYTTILKNVDKNIFLSRTHKDTLKARLARKRDHIDPFDKKILAIEHNIISKHKKKADIVFSKTYKTFTSKKHPPRKIKRIAMLSVHGHVDARPILGKTDTGGQVTYILELSKALAQKGVKVDIYTRRFLHKKTIETVTRNVRIIRIPCCGQQFIPKEHLFPCLDAFVSNMDKFIKKHGLEYDIFHSHYWDAGYVAMRLSEKLGCFFVHTFHSLGAWKKEQMGGNPSVMERLYNFKLRIKWEKIIYKKTRALVMTSPAMIKRSKKLYNYTGKNNITIPAGVNTTLFRPLKKGEKDHKIDVPQNFVFWVGRFATNKGLDYLLEAFAYAIRKNKGLFLVIGGGSKNPHPEERELREKLHTIITRTQIKNRVFFTKHIKDSLIPTYYRKAKFFVLPSKFEPFGMTAVEAMACGTPLIVGKRAGVTKYLKNKVNCLVVNPANKKDLGWALRVLNRNDSFRRKIARNGLKIAQTDFSWKRIAERSITFYKTLLK